MEVQGRMLVIGGDSLIGRGLTSACADQDWAVWQTTRRRGSTSNRTLYLNLAEDPLTWVLPDEQLDVAVFCAATTSKRRCEVDPDASRRVNVSNLIALGEIMAARKAFVVLLSTNAVFDGRRPLAAVGDRVNPQSEYGRQKAEAERKLSSISNDVAIVRLGKVIEPNMPLLQSWVRDLKVGRPIHPFSDLVFAPISLRSAVACVMMVARNRTRGICHVSGGEDITYADAAFWMAREMGAESGLVQPIRSSQGRGRARVARYATLATDPVYECLGPTGWSAVRMVIEAENRRGAASSGRQGPD